MKGIFVNVYHLERRIIQVTNKEEFEILETYIKNRYLSSIHEGEVYISNSF